MVETEIECSGLAATISCEETNMQGEKFGEKKGKVTGMRGLPGQQAPAVEVSYMGHGKLFGVDVTEMGTYISRMQAPGVLFGEGQGVAMTKDGETIAWKGMGVGKPTGKGTAASYRYSISYQTTAPKLAKLNSLLGIGEWEVDENGNCKGITWEWK